MPIRIRRRKRTYEENEESKNHKKETYGAIRSKKGQGRGRKGQYRGRKGQGRKGQGRGRGRKGQGRGRNGQRIKPYEHMDGGTVEDIANGPPESRCYKVSRDSDPKKVAGAICHCVRIGGAPPALLCTGAQPINQAVKSIAIARQYFESEEDENDDGSIIDLVVTPDFESQTDHCTLRLRKTRPIDMDNDSSPLTSTATSDPYMVAGAIAGKIRDGERVSIRGIGPNAVFHAVESIAVSQQYLNEDNINIKFTPQFEEVEVANGKIRSCIHFAILPRQIDY